MNELIYLKVLRDSEKSMKSEGKEPNILVALGSIHAVLCRIHLIVWDFGLY